MTDAELERLNVRARAMMFSLSGELQQAQATLQKPPAIPPQQSGRDISNSDVYSTASAPTIPPIIPVPIPATTANTKTPTNNVPSGASPPSMPTAPGPGPILGGAGVGSIPPSTTFPTTGSPPPAPSVSQPVATSPIPLGPRGFRRQEGSIGTPNPNRPDRSFRSTLGDSHRGGPPAGIIGGQPATPLPRPDASAGSPRRVNPIGGVIGGGGAGTSPTGGAGSRPSGGKGFSVSNGLPPTGGLPGYGSPGFMGSTGRTGRTGRHDDHTAEPSRWDPDNPWRTRQGVDPVVRSPEEDGPIDPGPAIGIGR
ncbi:hypothetical protein F4558_004522 [Micromonospora profundi]|nr:hypothetical protein [Micromonospora profundi]